MQGLAAIEGSGPGSHSHCKPFSPVTLVFLPAVWTTKAPAFCVCCGRTNEWRRSGPLHAMGDEMTPPCLKVMNSMGGTERADEGGTLSGSDPLPTRLQTWAAQPGLDSLLFKAAGSSLHHLHIFRYLLLFGMNKTFSSPLGFFLRCVGGSGGPNSSPKCAGRFIGFWADQPAFSFFSIRCSIVPGESLES